MRGPLGAACGSLAKVGWRFVQPFVLESDVGTRFALTDVPPAMLSYHLQVSWSRMRGRAAAPSAGVSGQLEASQVQKVLKGGASVGYPAVLKAFVTQGLWSHLRLHNVGYDVPLGCPLCGASSDSLHHRLFHCRASELLRIEILQPSDVALLRDSPRRRSLVLGFQVMPDFEPARPEVLAASRSTGRLGRTTANRWRNSWKESCSQTGRAPR